MQIDWAEIRDEFPAMRKWTYLDTATLGLIPARGRAAIDEHFKRRDELANTDFAEWWNDVDCLRAIIARAMACAADDIAFFPNASSALALALSAIDWRDGDEIVTLAEEFPNQSYLAATLPGVRLIETSLDRMWDSMTQRTRMVAISAVNYQTGLRAPWETMIESLHDRGVFFYVDATQSFGALATSLKTDAPDMLAVNCYKWGCAPTGAAFAYIHREARGGLKPSAIGWRSDAGWRDMHALRQSGPIFSRSAEKYEGGMLAFPSLYGLKASLEWMLEIGQAAIEERVLALAQACGGDGSSPIVTMPVPGDALEIAAQLREDRILVSARRGRLRISPHFYNNRNDVDRLHDGIRRALQRG